MRDKIIPILNVCVALFVLLYSTYIYKITGNISLVTVVLLIAGLAPVLHMTWNYIKIKFEHHENLHHHYYSGR